MHSNILILNGPNLNMLGVREPDIYGSQTLDDIKKMCIDAAHKFDMRVDFRQSNSEGTLVTWIQDALNNFDGIIINAAAYTHTSVAIHDALKLHDIPIIEVHLSNPKEREEFRHNSYVEPVSSYVVAGKGGQGYIEALTFLSNHSKQVS
jgi:3-dehydroquinate dehydratase-2